MPARRDERSRGDLVTGDALSHRVGRDTDTVRVVYIDNDVLVTDPERVRVFGGTILSDLWQACPDEGSCVREVLVEIERDWTDAHVANLQGGYGS